MTPVIRALAIAALALAGALVTALPATAARPYVRVVSVTHMVAKNDAATLVARVAPPDAHCNLVIYLRSGPSAASGPGPRRAVKGRVAWKWTVSRSTSGGTWPIYVECGTTGIAKSWFRVV
jgi:hypothetical protein